MLATAPVIVVKGLKTLKLVASINDTIPLATLNVPLVIFVVPRIQSLR
jgi:hypothetical protein